MFGNVVTLVVGVAWPFVTLLLLFVYRRRVDAVLRAVEQRIEKGHKFSLFGMAFDSPTGAPLPPASSPADGDVAVLSPLQTLLGVTSGATVGIFVGELGLSRATPSVGSGDALAVAHVQGALLRIHGVAVTTTVVRRSLKEVEAALAQYTYVVAVGGPNSNLLSAAVLSENYLTYGFRTEGVHDKKAGTTYASHITGAREDGTDYAVIVSAAHSRQPDGKIVVLAGHSGYGTNAAAHLLTSTSLTPQLKRGGCLEMLVKVQIRDSVVGEPFVVDIRNIPTVEPLPFGRGWVGTAG
jgi:hypothetical protein